ncbi:MAG: NfeD family protein [Actinomycetaceae bacterium]|nr:NfeD family protein [Actinomycetaceae bacterium]
MGWVTFFIWLIIAVCCIFIELIGTDFVFLMLAGGAIGGAVIGLFFPSSLLAQVLVGAVVAVVLLLVLRPVIKRHLIKDLPAEKMNIDAVVGKRCRIVTPVNRDSGLVYLNGSQWSARTDTSDILPVGEYAYVDYVDGATVVVVRELSQHITCRKK